MFLLSVQIKFVCLLQILGNQVYDSYCNGNRSIFYPRWQLQQDVDVFWYCRSFHFYNSATDIDCGFCTLMGWKLGVQIRANWIEEMVNSLIFNWLYKMIKWYFFIFCFPHRYAALLISMLLLYGVAIIGYIFLFTRYTKVGGNTFLVISLLTCY